MKHPIRPQTVRVARIEFAWCMGAFDQLRPHLTEDERLWAETEDMKNGGDLLLPPSAHERALWQRHRTAVLEEWIAQCPGRRPALWWRCEAPEPRDGSESEAAYLKRQGLLSAAEARRIPKHAQQQRVKLKVVT